MSKIINILPKFNVMYLLYLILKHKLMLLLSLKMVLVKHLVFLYHQLLFQWIQKDSQKMKINLILMLSFYLILKNFVIKPIIF